MRSAAAPKIILGVVASFIALFGIAFLSALSPRDLPYRANRVALVIEPGSGLRDITDHLHEAGVIRSSAAATLYALLVGVGGDLKPGRYELSSASSTQAIMAELVHGSVREVEVRIPEGSTVYQVDEILAGAGVLPRGAIFLYPYVESRGTGLASTTLEGRLFPDTYRFHTDSGLVPVVERLLAAFERKAVPLLPSDPGERLRTLILASLLEREVPEFEDRRLVAGILEKRLKAGMPLQVDATVCYAKSVALRAPASCLPLTLADLRIQSPYNTYVVKGLPPGPIGSPGEMAIRAALAPKASPYWFYLSDPKTGDTIFSRNLDEHVLNKAKYLR